VIKKTSYDDEWVIGRYPRNAPKNWIEANEKEIAEWDTGKLDRKISVMSVRNI
jgi:hypothetical protein